MLKHIAFGFIVAYSFFLFFYVRQRFSADSKLLARLPLILLCCAIWSIIPNIVSHLPLGIIGKIITNPVISNIFFFHGILRLLPMHGSTFGLGGIYFVFFSLMLIFVRHLWIQEREIAALGKAKGGK